MKKAIVATVVVLMAASSLFGQTPESKISFYVNSGMSIPISPTAFSDYWKSALNFGGGAGYDLSRYVALQGMFTYNSFGFNETKLFEKYGVESLNPSIEGGGYKIITFTANIKASFIARGKSVTPYFVGGLGFFSMSQDDATLFMGSTPVAAMSGDSKSTLSSCLGFGVDIMVMEKAGVFVEFTSTAGAVELVTDIPDTEDGIVGYVVFRIGAIIQL